MEPRELFYKHHNAYFTPKSDLPTSIHLFSLLILHKVEGSLEPIPGDPRHKAGDIPGQGAGPLKGTSTYYGQIRDANQPTIWELIIAPSGNCQRRICKLHTQGIGRNQTHNPGGFRQTC